ncbi:GPALPP motifs-containing protein 1, partial [Linum grandiflorum]
NLRTTFLVLERKDNFYFLIANCKQFSTTRTDPAMGKKSKRKHRDDTPNSSSGSEEDDTDYSSETSSERRRRHRKDRRNSDGSSKREKEKRKRKKERKERESDRRRRKSKRKSYDSDSQSESDSGKEGPVSRRAKPEAVVKEMLAKFPGVAGDLKQLLQMIDAGQAVDIGGISEKTLAKHLKKLFVSLKLEEKDDQVFLLPLNHRPTLEIIGSLIEDRVEPKGKQADDTATGNGMHPVCVDDESGQVLDDKPMLATSADVPPPRKRMMGPAMPSSELLAAAAKLTEAQEELRTVELEEDNNELFVGPPPPAIAAEAASVNEAERFEEVTRIMDSSDDSPYDVVGVNHKMSADNIKKRYWKLSLLVHPDKCSHPQAQQAFVKLNKAFKDLQDVDKRKILDEKIKQKEEQEAFKAELKGMQEAAQWRRLQGISMEGDDELLAQLEVKVAPKRDEWMTTLPPERKAGGVTMQSTKAFSKDVKEGRGDTSAWTDTPSDRALKAKMNYLEAYDAATALASNEQEKKQANADADLVDKYNKAKRSKSLVQKHQEELSKKKTKQQKQKEKEEWTGQHPWKPWDRDKDLSAGRQNVKLDAENMGQGLTSRFSSANFQRNFL